VKGKGNITSSRHGGGIKKKRKGHPRDQLLHGVGGREKSLGKNGSRGHAPREWRFGLGLKGGKGKREKKVKKKEGINLLQLEITRIRRGKGRFALERKIQGEEGKKKKKKTGQTERKNDMEEPGERGKLPSAIASQERNEEGGS